MSLRGGRRGGRRGRSRGCRRVRPVVARAEPWRAQISTSRCSVRSLFGSGRVKRKPPSPRAGRAGSRSRATWPGASAAVAARSRRVSSGWPSLSTNCLGLERAAAGQGAVAVLHGAVVDLGHEPDARRCPSRRRGRRSHGISPGILVILARGPAVAVQQQADRAAARRGRAGAGSPSGWSNSTTSGIFVGGRGRATSRLDRQAAGDRPTRRPLASSSAADVERDDLLVGHVQTAPIRPPGRLIGRERIATENRVRFGAKTWPGRSFPAIC